MTSVERLEMTLILSANPFLAMIFLAASAMGGKACNYNEKLSYSFKGIVSQCFLFSYSELHVPTGYQCL